MYKVQKTSGANYALIHLALHILLRAIAASFKFINGSKRNNYTKVFLSILAAFLSAPDLIIHTRNRIKRWVWSGF
ncbi:hypothetical protein V6N12_018445 [Hibiscus sabdariffa]|uniref:Uncharacterized protein n=1 Tax=Hibiscus sabdariffa TaxID=183260 RepID=A0ABR2BQE4_9ROSI